MIKSNNERNYKKLLFTIVHYYLPYNPIYLSVSLFDNHIVFLLFR